MVKEIRPEVKVFFMTALEINGDSYVEAFKHAEEISGTLKRWRIRVR